MNQEQVKYDFSTWEANCHFLGELMSPAKGKSNLEKYNDLNSLYEKKFNEYEETVNKQTATAKKLLASIKKVSEGMDALESIKDFPHLSSACKSRLNQVYTEVTEGVKKSIHSKYLKKGLAVEEDAITLYSEFTGVFHKKNTVRMTNGYLTGEMDFDEVEGENHYACDTKSSWDIFSFDAVRFKPINPIYDWQLEGYCWLFKKGYGRLVYCLLNTPEHMIKSEENKLMYEMFGSEGNMAKAPDEMILAYKEGCAEIRKIHIHDSRPLSRRVKIFETKANPDRVELIKKKIEECRWYLNNIENLNEKEDDTES